MNELSMLSSHDGAHAAPDSATSQLLERAADAGDHPLLRRLRTGTARSEEVLAWLQCRYCLAEHLAKKEVLVLAKAKDREGRRLWVQRVLALDGYGDFYGPTKHGLIETWKKLFALVPTTSNTSLLSAELSAHLELLFGQHLLQIRDADWIESLGISVVDDWVVQNDLMTANLLSVAGQSMGSFRSSGKPAICTALSATTFGALDSELANFNDQRFWEQALKAVDARVEFEHAILTAAQKHSLLR